MPLEFQNATVVQIIDETYNTKRFFLEIENTTNFDFKPGQFITLDLPIHEKKNKRIRSYSIASAPNGTNIVELVIVLLEGGLGTTYLFNEVKVGTVIPFRGALGHFTLPEIITEDLFFICTGTGIAPFRSMVNYIHAQNIEHKNIYLIFGVRTQADLLYHQEMSALQNNMPGFKYLPTLSRETWEGGATGYVHEIYTQYCIDKPHAEFMLCGWRAMVDEAKEKLMALGYDKKQIHLELYG